MKLLATLAVLVAATIGSASASVLQYNTTGSNFFGAGFTTGSGTAAVTVVNGADVATLTYVPPSVGDSFVNTPTNVSYGFIQESYVGNPLDGINLPAFTFNLVINNVTDGATATFIGTAAASTITTASNNLNIFWTPQPLLDGTASFFINSPTSIPTDNTLAGQASLQGSVTNSAPEPGSLLLMGAGLVGLGFTARKKFASRS